MQAKLKKRASTADKKWSSWCFYLEFHVFKAVEALFLFDFFTTSGVFSRFRCPTGATGRFAFAGFAGLHRLSAAGLVRGRGFRARGDALLSLTHFSEG